MPLVLLDISDCSGGLSRCRCVKLCPIASCSRLDDCCLNGMLQSLAQSACLQIGLVVYGLVCLPTDAQYGSRSACQDRAWHAVNSMTASGAAVLV